MASTRTVFVSRIVLRAVVFISLSVGVTAVGPRRCYWCGPLAEQVHRSQRAPSCSGPNTHVTLCEEGFPHCAIVATSPPHVESRYCVKFYQDECYSLYCNSTKTWRMTCPCRGDLCNGPHTEREDQAFTYLAKLVAKHNNARIKRAFKSSTGFIGKERKNRIDDSTSTQLNPNDTETIVSVEVIDRSIQNLSNITEIDFGNSLQNQHNDEIQSDLPETTVENMDINENASKTNGLSATTVVNTTVIVEVRSIQNDTEITDIIIDQSMPNPSNNTEMDSGNSLQKQHDKEMQSDQPGTNVKSVDKSENAPRSNSLSATTIVNTTVNVEVKSIQNDTEITDIVIDRSMQNLSNITEMDSGNSVQKQNDEEMQSDQPRTNIESADKTENAPRTNGLSDTTVVNNIHKHADENKDFTQLTTQTSMATEIINKDTTVIATTTIAVPIAKKLKNCDKEVKPSEQMPPAEALQHNEAQVVKTAERTTMDTTAIMSTQSAISTEATIPRNNTASQINKHILTISIGIILHY